MLKLTYTDFGLHMEHLTLSPDAFVAQRSVLAIRCGQSLHIAPGRASFLLPASTPGLADLDAVLRKERGPAIAISPVDEAYVEVSLGGSWIADWADAHEGTFLVAASARVEQLLYTLWQQSHMQISSFAW